MAKSSNSLVRQRQKETGKRGCWVWAGWEPDRFYKRVGANSTSYFGNGDWIPSWRNRIESDEMLRKLADQGATVLITRFFKGMGPEVEKADWPRLAEFVERANRHHLDVWGYMQGLGIFGEFVFPVRPEAREWVARDFSGNAQTWAGVYYRFAPCLGNAGYQAYVKDILTEGVGNIGLNGIHLDNSYYKHCYCTNCRQEFRKWLEERGDLEIRTGIPSADAVEPPPPVSPDMSVIPDPLVQLWIEFGVLKRLEFLARTDQNGTIANWRPFPCKSCRCGQQASYQCPGFPRFWSPDREG